MFRLNEIGHWARLWLVGCVLSIALIGCRSGGVTPIGDLLDDPSRYDGKSVRIAGDVKEAAGVLGYGTYRVDDGTGTLLVLTRSGGVPREGAEIGVEGIFRSVFTLGDISGAVLMEERRVSR